MKFKISNTTAKNIYLRTSITEQSKIIWQKPAREKQQLNDTDVLDLSDDLSS